jgi:UDP-N-acetylglucosamine 2-epimerase (non-hydrolysing)
MKVIIVVGARPNFMKAAPIIRAIRTYNTEAMRADAGHGGTIEPILVHTGQHYDALMSDSFFADLNLPVPDIQLGVGSGSQSWQTAEILKRFETVLLEHRPDVVIVVGDVSSTVACALATVKIPVNSAARRPLLAHVEAGLRSRDRSMPEEINRIVTDHLSDLLFVTEESGIQNLQAEGVAPGAVHFVGNTMIDSLLAFKDKAEESTILERLGFRQKARGNGHQAPIARYALLTLHRPANVDNREAFLNILGGLEELMQECPVVFPVHPRTRQRISEFGVDSYLGMREAKGGEKRGGIILTDPLGYLDFVCLMKHASIVVTDSGGIQEETTCLGIPCVTARENTERPVTISHGTNILAGTTKEKIAASIRQQMGRSSSGCIPKHWDGQAASRILDVLVRAHREQGPDGLSVLPNVLPQEPGANNPELVANAGETR